MSEPARTAAAAGPAEAPDARARPRLRGIEGGADLVGARRRPLPKEVPPARRDPHRRLRVLVVAEEEIVHWGFRALLAGLPWVEHYETARDAAQAREAARRRDLHVAVVEMREEDASGLALSAALTRDAPGIAVLLMGRKQGVSPGLARSAGAAGSISRSSSADGLRAAVQLAGRGLPVFAEPARQTGDVSPREREIIRLIAEGATNSEIGDALYLSPNTVKQQASVLYRKLDARNRAEAVQRAQRLGLIA